MSLIRVRVMIARNGPFLLLLASTIAPVIAMRLSIVKRASNALVSMPASQSEITLRMMEKAQYDCHQFQEPFSSVIKVGGVINSNGSSYMLRKCLGAGSFGEAWLAQLPSGEDAVIKILKDSTETSLTKECDFARLAKTHLSSNVGVRIADCLGMGELDGGVPFVIFELAQGGEFEGLLSKHSDKLHAVLPNVGKVLLRLKEMHDFMEDLAAEGEDGLKLFHMDLHPGNLFMTEEYVTAIDYGVIGICCAAASCPKAPYSGTEFDKCGDQAEEYANAGKFWLAVDTIAFFIEKPSGKELKFVVMDFAISRVSEEWGEVESLQNIVRPEFHDGCSVNSPCDRALYAAALIMRGKQAPCEELSDLSAIIAEGSHQM